MEIKDPVLLQNESSILQSRIDQSFVKNRQTFANCVPRTKSGVGNSTAQ